MEPYSVPDLRFDVELRVLLFAGILVGCNLDQVKICPATQDVELSCVVFSMFILNQAC